MSMAETAAARLAMRQEVFIMEKVKGFVGELESMW
jgi:hypothetical protein